MPDSSDNPKKPEPKDESQWVPAREYRKRYFMLPLDLQKWGNYRRRHWLNENGDHPDAYIKATSHVPHYVEPDNVTEQEDNQDKPLEPDDELLRSKFSTYFTDPRIFESEILPVGCQVGITEALYVLSAGAMGERAEQVWEKSQSDLDPDIWKVLSSVREVTAIGKAVVRIPGVANNTKTALLLYMAGFNLREIAGILGVSHTTVMRKIKSLERKIVTKSQRLSFHFIKDR